MRISWSAPVPYQEAWRRAGGRRRRASRRHAAAEERRARLVNLITHVGLRRGQLAWLAAGLGASRYTNSRDIRRLFGALYIPRPNAQQRPQNSHEQLGN